MNINFNQPFLAGKELDYINQAARQGRISGDGSFTKYCNKWFEEKLNTTKCLLTHSCTAALEMMALLGEIGAGDEVIMPSYTFVSTANAFVLRGATPVFVDIRADTLNINEKLIEQAITAKTKAIVPVHYAGVGCEMEEILNISRKHHLFVFEDAAQAILSKYRGKYLGTFGDLGAFSFHETKNIISGEGGALCVNNEKLKNRAEIIREKGTDRAKFFRGEVDKYTWVDIGSSYLPGEVIAAFLKAQLEAAEDITYRRVQAWNLYHELLNDLETQGKLRRPIIPEDCEHNGHMYYILVGTASIRSRLIEFLKAKDIHTVFHYIPLHSSPAGRKYSRVSGEMSVTDRIASCLIRLPMHNMLTREEILTVVKNINLFFING